MRQGYVLSSDLILLYTQLVLEELTECDGVEIGAKNVSNIRYADCLETVADSEEKLQ